MAEQGSVQHQVLRKLRRRIVSKNDDTPLTIVTGLAGTGKSFVLRNYARILSWGFLNGDKPVARLPILIPLQQFPKHSDEPLWDWIETKWIKWANSLVDSEPLTVGWLQKRMENEPTALILDSVDEFLVKSTKVLMEDFHREVLNLRMKLRSKRKTHIILGIRLAEPAYDLFKEDADQILTIRPLTIEECKANFDRAVPVIERAVRSGNRDALAVLRTPLVLRALQTDVDDPDDTDQLKTRADILKVATNTHIKKSRLHEQPLNGHGMARVSDWNTALSVLSMLFSAGHCGRMSDLEIKSKAAEVIQRWTDAGRTTEQLLRAGMIFEGEQTRRKLMTRTFFFPAGKDLSSPDRPSETYRFQHREWHDFLLGYYMAQCVRGLNFDELIRLAFTQRAFQAAGELLQSEAAWVGVDNEEFARAVVTRMGEPLGQFVLGNIGGLLANSYVPVSEEALNVFAENVDKMPLPGKLTFLAGLGYRLLRKSLLQPGDEDSAGAHEVDADEPQRNDEPSGRDEQDESWDELFDATVRMLKRSVSSHQTCQEQVIASLSWCYLSAFLHYFPEDCEKVGLVSGGFGSLPELPPILGGEESPEIDLEKGREAIVDLLAGEPGPDGRFQPIPPHYKSVQLAYLNIQEVVDVSSEMQRNASPRLISLVHYLYTLSWTVRLETTDGPVAIPEVRRRLKSILQNPRIADLYQDFAVPEVGDMFLKCRALGTVTN